MVSFIIAAVLIATWAVVTYNRLITLQNQAIEGWSGIDVQLRRRYNLIPQLVEVVKGYQRHEEATLTQLTALRAAALEVSAIEARGDAESNLAAGLERLLAIVEGYPDLKSNQTYASLHKDLVQTEDALQLARRYYNGTVRDYNTKVQSFPSLVVAAALRFHPRAYFEIHNPEERTNPPVELT